jgi:hypothetical protein
VLSYSTVEIGVGDSNALNISGCLDAAQSVMIIRVPHPKPNQKIPVASYGCLGAKFEKIVVDNGTKPVNSVNSSYGRYHLLSFSS